MALLKVNDLTVAFDTREGTQLAVNQVHFELEKGQILGIVGESGSGKSVACYSLLGLIPMPPGRLVSGVAELDGVDLLKMSENQLRSIRGNRIGMIFQDPMTSLNPHLTIASQLIEPLIVHDKMSTAHAREKAIAVLNEVGIRDAESRMDSYPHEFSGGMRQRVMIAMALIKEPEILIADEPTTALDVTVQLQILELIKHIQRERGLSVIFISHDLAVVADLADHVLVMEKGNVVESGPARQVLEFPSHPYTQKLIAAVPKTAKSDVHKWQADSQEAFLVVRSLHKTFSKKSKWPWQKAQKGVHAVEDVSLTIGAGEIVGLVGESGSGKSTLGRCIIRLRRPDSGEVLFQGVDYLRLSSAELQQKRHNFQMIFQDPYASLNPRMTVFDTLVEPLKCHRLVPPSQYLEEVNRLMDDVGLARGLIRKYPHEFSGGQRQRIAIARALAMRPQFIVADEPVSALDVTIQAQILELLLALTKKYKLTMLFISHDLAVVRYISDRVLVMKQGRIVEQGPTEEIFCSPKQDYTKSLLSSIRDL